MVTKRRNIKGFSLAELLIVTAIAGVLLVIGPKLLVQTFSFFSRQRAMSDLQYEGRDATDLMLRFLRDGRASTLVIDQLSTPPEAPFSRISFTTIEGTKIEFYKSGNTLVKSSQLAGMPTPTVIVITKHLNTLLFTCARSDDPGTVSVSLSLERPLPDGTLKTMNFTIRRIRLMNL